MPDHYTLLPIDRHYCHWCTFIVVIYVNLLTTDFRMNYVFSTLYSTTFESLIRASFAVRSHDTSKLQIALSALAATEPANSLSSKQLSANVCLCDYHPQIELLKYYHTRIHGTKCHEGPTV